MLVLLVTALIAGCGDEDTATPRPQRIAVLSAFPAELAAVLQHVVVTSREAVGNRTFTRGTIEGVAVVVGMTGIGLVNAEVTARQLLDQEAFTGVVFSGVAGSTQRIADVAVPDLWQTDDAAVYVVDPEWLELAQASAATAVSSFDHCTTVVTPPRGEVCLGFAPALVIGGLGVSSDPFGGVAQECRPGGGDVFGCDVESVGAALRRARASVSETPLVSDMESGAVAAVAAARGLPFIAFRGVSDGEQDPLGLPGFPSQFFAYYKLAAHNAAVAAATFVAQLAEPGL